MSDLVSMKIDPAKREDYAKPSTLADAPVYPYGLCVHLDGEVMEKLGMKTLPAAGTDLRLTAKVTVTSVSENSYSTAGKTETRQSMSVQITAMALDATSSDTAKSLYGE